MKEKIPEHIAELYHKLSFLLLIIMLFLMPLVVSSRIHSVMIWYIGSWLILVVWYKKKDYTEDLCLMQLLILILALASAMFEDLLEPYSAEPNPKIFVFGAAIIFGFYKVYQILRIWDPNHEFEIERLLDHSWVQTFKQCKSPRLKAQSLLSDITNETIREYIKFRTVQFLAIGRSDWKTVDELSKVRVKDPVESIGRLAHIQTKILDTMKEENKSKKKLAKQEKLVISDVKFFLRSIGEIKNLLAKVFQCMETQTRNFEFNWECEALVITLESILKNESNIKEPSYSWVPTDCPN